jgi:HAMP domain-containing protein
MLCSCTTGLELELLLNLCCLLLFGPAIYLWLQRRRVATSVLQFSVALACLLFLLFPVISASDDLHAMRQEMEESGPSKRTLKQAGRSAPGHDITAPPAELPAVARVVPTVVPSGRVLGFAPVAPSSSESVALVSRAPPSFLLA